MPNALSLNQSLFVQLSIQLTVQDDLYVHYTAAQESTCYIFDKGFI